MDTVRCVEFFCRNTLCFWPHDVIKCGICYREVNSSVRPSVRPSICPSVCLSVTHVNHVQTVRDIKVYFTYAVEGRFYFLKPNFAILCIEVHPKQCVRETPLSTELENWINILLCLGNGAREEKYWYLYTGSRIRAHNWYRNRWPWVTLNGVTLVNTVHHFTEFGTFGPLTSTYLKLEALLQQNVAKQSIFSNIWLMIIIIVKNLAVYNAF